MIKDRRSCLHRSLGILAALILGLVIDPAWALGPGAPPIFVYASVEIVSVNDGSPTLNASVAVEIPGGRVPQDVASVTVLVPGESTPRYLARETNDLVPDRNFGLDLKQAGVVGFPLGTYLFTVTDTAGGAATATDALTAAATLLCPVISSHTPDQLIQPIPQTISWTAVPGAAIYRLRIRNGYMDLDLFARYTPDTSVTLPSGVLVPGRRYRIQVEAWDHVNGGGCGTPGCTDEDSNGRSIRRFNVEAQGPDIFLTFPQGPYTAGNILDLTARVWNTHAPVTVDAVVWVGLPGSATPLNILEFKNVLIPQNLSGDVYSGPLGFAYTFTGAEPNGVYVVGFRLYDPQTKETIAVTTRTFTKS